MPIKIIESFPDPGAAKYDSALWYRQHANKMVIINCRSSYIEFPEHWSPLSVKCAFGGKEYYHFKDASLAAGDDSFLIINEGSLYKSSINTKTVTESFTINFTSQNINDVYVGLSSSAGRQLENPFTQQSNTISFVEKMYHWSGPLTTSLMGIRQLVKEKEQSDGPYIEHSHAALESMLMLHANTKIEIENVLAVKASTKEELYKRLTLARDYMESCFSENISLDRLSAVCFLNTHYLLRQFKLMYNTTPHRYLTRKRLNEAASLLKKPGIPITDIASAVGFADAGSFSKLFRKNYGSSPEQFRRNYASS